MEEPGAVDLAYFAGLFDGEGHEEEDLARQLRNPVGTKKLVEEVSHAEQK